MSTDVMTSASAIVGGGFFGRLLFGYALKKVVKMIAFIVGLFIAGLAYLQYQQIASFDWNRIEVMASAALGNVTTQITNSQEDNSIFNVKLWYSIDRKYVSWICGWFYERMMMDKECFSIEATKHTILSFSKKGR